MLSALCVVACLNCAFASQGEAQGGRLAVLDFLRPAGSVSDYGKVAAQAFLTATVESTTYRIIDPDRARRVASSLGYKSPRAGMLALIRVGEGVGADVIVRGEVIECGVDLLGGDKRAWATLRAIAYDVPSAQPCNGAMESAEAMIRPRDSTDEVLVSEAVRLAAVKLVRRMQLTVTPKATVTNFEEGTPLINQGSRGGFHTGGEVVFMRGLKTLGRGTIGATEADQAVVTPQGALQQIAPGDRVWAVFDFPLERSHARSSTSRVLDVDRGSHPHSRGQEAQ